MKKNKTEEIILITVIASLLLIAGIVGAVIYHIHKIKQENYEFEQNYINQLQSNGMEIRWEHQYIYNGSDILGNAIYKDVNEDVFYKKYYHELEVYDPEFDYQYTIKLGHEAGKRMEVLDSDMELYRERADIYSANFKLMQEIIEQHGGQAKCVTQYSVNGYSDYILLIYLPDAVSMIETQEELYDQIYGGYADEHTDVTNGVNISIPRFIFCAKEDTYQMMCGNLEYARNYTSGKNYACNNSHAGRDDIRLQGVCEILLWDRLDEFQKYEIPDVNTLSSPADKQALMSVTVSDWIALYELEVGVDYYLTIYEKQE